MDPLLVLTNGQVPRHDDAGSRPRLECVRSVAGRPVLSAARCTAHLAAKLLG
jgi:hypothetical protein